MRKDRGPISEQAARSVSDRNLISLIGSDDELTTPGSGLDGDEEENENVDTGLDSSPAVAQAKLKALLDERCPAGLYETVTHAYRINFTLNFQNAKQWHKQSRHGDRSAPLALDSDILDLVAAGFPDLKLMFSYGCRCSSENLHDFKTTYAKLHGHANMNDDTQGQHSQQYDRHRLSVFLCHQLPRSIVEHIQFQRCEEFRDGGYLNNASPLLEHDDVLEVNAVKSPECNSVMLLQGNANDLAVELHLENQVLTKIQYVSLVTKYLSDAIEKSEAIPLDHFADALYSIAILHRECKLSPSQYVLAQRTFVEKGTLGTLFTSLTAGYTAQYKPLPVGKSILAEVNPEETLYLKIHLEENEASHERVVKTSERINTVPDKDCPINSALWMAALAAQEDFPGARQHLQKLNIDQAPPASGSQKQNDNLDFFIECLDKVLKQNIQGDSEGLSCHYVVTGNRSLRKKWKEPPARCHQLSGHWADIGHLISHSLSKLRQCSCLNSTPCSSCRVAVLGAKEEARFEFYAAKAAFQNASDLCDLKEHAGFAALAADEKADLEKSCFPPLPDQQWSVDGKPANAERFSSVQERIIKTRDELDLVGSLTWDDKAATRAVVRDQTYAVQPHTVKSMLQELNKGADAERRRKQFQIDEDADGNGTITLLATHLVQTSEEEYDDQRNLTAKEHAKAARSIVSEFCEQLDSAFTERNHDTVLGHILQGLGHSLNLDQPWCLFDQWNPTLKGGAASFGARRRSTIGGNDVSSTVGNQITDDGLEDFLWWCPDITIEPNFTHCPRLSARVKDGVRARIRANQIFFNYEGRIAQELSNPDDEQSEIRIPLQDKLRRALSVSSYHRDPSQFMKGLVERTLSQLMENNTGAAMVRAQSFVKSESSSFHSDLDDHVAHRPSAAKKSSIGMRQSVQRFMSRRSSRKEERKVEATPKLGDLQGWLECVLKANILDVLKEDFFWRFLDDDKEQQQLLPKASLAEVLVDAGTNVMENTPELGRYVMDRSFDFIVFPRGFAVSFAKQKIQVEFLSEQAQYEKGLKTSVENFWLHPCSKGGCLFIFSILAWVMFFFCMTQTVAILSCDVPHLRSANMSGSCNFRTDVRVYSDLQTWPNAKSLCTQRGGSLVSLPDNASNVAVSSQLARSFNGECEQAWFGATDQVDEGVFLWSDGSLKGQAVSFNDNTTFRAAPWFPQPHFFNSSIASTSFEFNPNGVWQGLEASERDCAAVFPNGSWTAESCLKTLCFACTAPADESWSSFFASLGSETLGKNVWHLLLMSLFCIAFIWSVAEAILSHISIYVRLQRATTVEHLTEMFVNTTEETPTVKYIVLTRLIGIFPLTTFVEKERSGTEIKRVSVVRIGFPFPMGEGSLVTDKSGLLPYLVNGRYRKTFTSNVSLACIDWKWGHYGLATHLIEMILYCLFLFELTMLTISLSAFESSQITVDEYIHMGCVFLFALRLMMQEIHQAIFGPNGINHFFNGWNMLDSALYLTIIVFPWMVLFGDPNDAWRFRVIIAWANVLSWLKFLNFLAPLKFSSMMIAALVQAVPDAFAVFIILAVVLFGFAASFLSATADRVKEFSSLSVSIFSAFRMMLGEYDLVTTMESSGSYDSSHTVVTTLFVLFVFGVGIVLLNLFIAVVTDSYEKVREQGQITTLHQKAAILLDLEILNKRENLFAKLYERTKASLAIATDMAGVDSTTKIEYVEKSPLLRPLIFLLHFLTSFYKTPGYGVLFVLPESRDDRTISIGQRICSCTQSVDQKMARFSNSHRALSFLIFLVLQVLALCIFASLVVYGTLFWALFVFVLIQTTMLWKRVMGAIGAQALEPYRLPKWLYLVMNRKDLALNQDDSMDDWTGSTHAIKKEVKIARLKNHEDNVQIQLNIQHLQDRLDQQQQQQQKTDEKLDNILNLLLSQQHNHAADHRRGAATAQQNHDQLTNL